MLYYELIDKLKQIASTEPNINFVGNKDIYELNSNPEIDYSVFYVTPNTFQIDTDLNTYSLNLYYVDRWDETGNNQAMIQSTGIIVLQNIINKFSNQYPDVEIQYPMTAIPFYQKFKDMCAGVYITVSFNVENEIGLCYEN